MKIPFKSAHYSGFIPVESLHTWLRMEDAHAVVKDFEKRAAHGYILTRLEQAELSAARAAQLRHCTTIASQGWQMTKAEFAI